MQHLNLFKISLLLSVFLFVATSSFAKAKFQPMTKQEIATIIPSESRHVVSLAGKWQRSYDEENWEDIRLPYSETISSSVTYQKAIKIPTNLISSRTWHLHFLGIDHQVEVYVNDQFLGKTVGAMTPFELRIPERMLSGSANTLKLRISPATNVAAQAKQQHLSAKEVFTGMLREVLLVGTPNVWVSGIKYKLQFAGNYASAKVKSTVNISTGKIQDMISSGAFVDSLGNPTSKKAFVTLQAEIRRKLNGALVAKLPDVKIQLHKERTITKSFTLGVNSPAMWSMKNPELYFLTAKLVKNDKVIDDYSTELGFRNFEVKRSKKNPIFRLNSKPFELKAITYVEDFAKTNATLSAQRMREDVEIIKTLGANAIRFKYYPPHPYLVHLCNTNGIFILVDLPIYDIPTALVATDEIQVDIKNIAKQFITKYEATPSVLAWGITNGIKEATPPAHALLYFH